MIVTDENGCMLLGSAAWADWYAICAAKGHPGPYVGTENPVQSFAENLKRALWSPYYTYYDYPRTNLPWLSRAAMKAFVAKWGGPQL